MSTSPLLKGLVGVAGNLAVGCRSSGICREIYDVLGVIKMNKKLVIKMLAFILVKSSVLRSQTQCLENLTFC